MKKFLVAFVLLIIFIFIIFFFSGGLNYFQKLFFKTEEKITTSTPRVPIKSKYKFFDEELLKEIKYDEKTKSVVVGKIGFKNLNEPTAEFDKKKIYMPFDGRIKAEKIPADDPLGDLFYTRLNIYEPIKNKIIVIWGSFLPVNLEFKKEVFRTQGSVVGEFPVIDLSKTQDFFNDFVVIYALDGKTYNYDVEFLKEIFPDLIK